MKVTVTIPKDFGADILNLRKNVAEAIVGVVSETFDHVVKTSPQYSGQFVANTVVNDVEGPGASGFPKPKNVQDALSRGHDKAISYAKNNNRSSMIGFTSGISYGVGWIPTVITISNKRSRADVIEGLDEDELREVNFGGAHPFEQGRERLIEKALSITQYMSPKFILAMEAGKRPLS